jgi:hypothetical protein
MKMSHYGRELAPSEADANEVAALYVRAMKGWNLGSGDAFAAPLRDTDSSSLPIWTARRRSE